MNSRTKNTSCSRGYFQDSSAYKSRPRCAENMGFQMTPDVDYAFDGVNDNYMLSSSSYTGRHQNSQVGPWMDSLLDNDDSSKYAHPVATGLSAYEDMEAAFLPDMMHQFGPDSFRDDLSDDTFSGFSQDGPFEASLQFPQSAGLVDASYVLNTAGHPYYPTSSPTGMISDLPTPPLTEASSGSSDCEDVSQLYFQLPGPMAGMPTSPVNRHGIPAPAVDETLPYEYLGQSRLKTYSGPIRSAGQHQRPLRSASDRDARLVSPQFKDGSLPVDENEENQKARKDPRYERKADKDGYFRCPFQDEQSCTHKPTKQKCIYAKYLDSHIRPYRCKQGSEECRDKFFSSNACLFRHEREAHGMHGHGDNPHLCYFTDCDRAKPGNGFPRKWNLGDHMKRVHGFDVDKEGVSARQGDRIPKKRQGSSSSSGSVQMKRTTSSHAKAQIASAAYSRDVRHLHMSQSYSRHSHDYHQGDYYPAGHRY